ncbi:RlpA-like double-psi beta-barrel-protein domain-containing protein-containing protein [Kockovaella imperatae]|uniref:RlpA-like double-psi beta-barrel-protein domain-containing protein-containing protein n=1 Tax=Kockovaella imperatae TaxID=4999 RepID=A0A1Y1UP96_9TREE|nr:RlpA-like double-psi beta-barrel-protein domain-containing protein-containing protein [Kockovaella imperatae]ORX39829.1 RlpA-like double-psi beta-barrel-protein domain-containing protein-containing protein [Kockovaella imperatae]
MLFSTALLLSSLVSLLPSISARPQPFRAQVQQPATRNHNETLSERAFDGMRATYYAVGLGACGWYNQPSDYIVALNSDQYGGGYPGPQCGKMITISYNGNTAVAQIADECPSCPYGGLDLSQGLFEHFADTSVGVIYVDWWYNDGSGGGGGGNQPSPSPSPSPTPTPTTTWQAPPTTTSTWQAPTTTSTYSPPPPPSSSSSTTPTTTSTSSTTPSTSTTSTTSSSASTLTSSASHSGSTLSVNALGISTNGTVLPAAATMTVNGTSPEDSNTATTLGNLLVFNEVVARLGNLIVAGAEYK